MEMTYGGALVMPSSYAMMDEEEMMYVEGGWVPRSTNWISVPIDIVCGIISLNASAIMGCAGLAIAKLAAKKWAVIASHEIIQNMIGAAGTSMLTLALNAATKNNTVVSLLTTCTSFGGIFGLMFDTNDGILNDKFNSPV